MHTVVSHKFAALHHETWQNDHLVYLRMTWTEHRFIQACHSESLKVIGEIEDVNKTCRTFMQVVRQEE